MKRLYVFFAALIAGGMITAGGNAVSAQKLNKEVKRPKMMVAPRKAAAATERMPQSEKIYTWDYDAGKWVLSTDSKMKYEGALMMNKDIDVYNAGEVNFSIRESYSYDENNNKTESVIEESYDAGGTWNKSERDIWSYDVIRKDMPVLNERYFWDSGMSEWYLDEENEDGFFLEIERDSKDRVVKSTKWLNSTKSIALVTNEFEYGSELIQGCENHATSMKWNALNDNFELVPAYIYEDMKWQESDGQYLNIVPNIYYAFDMDANNKLVGYTLYDANADGTKGAQNATYTSYYDEKGRLYYVEMALPDGVAYQCTYKYDKDENGSFEFFEIMSGDFDGNGNVDFPYEYLMNSTYTTCNSHGEIIKEEMYDVDASMNMTLTEGYTYDMVYDEEDLLTEVTRTYFTTMTGGTWENLSKTVYGDYTADVPTGITNAKEGPAGVSVNNNTLYFSNARGAHYTITDLSGKIYARGVVTEDMVKVDNMPEGMYIVKISGRNSNNAVKLLKK